MPLSPKVNAYYDVNKVKGLYVEGSVSHGFPLGAATLNLGALAGWTGGQEINASKPTELYNFSSKGLTHVDLSASVAFSAGPVSLTPAIHGVIAHDPFTKVTKIGTTSDFKLWGGVTISWSKAFGAKEEEKKE